MSEAQIRLECLKLAVTMTPADRSYDAVAKIATMLYDFCNAPLVPEKAPEIVDKPSRKQLKLPNAQPHA